VQTIRELNQNLHDREDVELHAAEESSRGSSGDPYTSTAISGNYIDAVVCSHEFTDHCHRKTLEEIDPSVPCLATTKAAELIRSWDHFEQVFDVPPFGKGSDWRKTSASSLPPWIRIARLVTESDALYYHSAIAIFFKDPNSIHAAGAEAIIYTPHGIRPEDLGSIPIAVPQIRTLALLHGLHDVSISLFQKQLNLGAHNALKCQIILRSKYWANTHDEIKIGGGILAPFLRRKAYSLQDALEAQEWDLKAAGLPADEAHYSELASGETLLLK